MRPVVTWSEQVPDRDGEPTPIYSLAFNPDGSQLVAAVGSRVVLYDAADGDVVQSLKAHTNTVYCVAWSNDGKQFASGDADKTVIIWTAKGEGVLKFTHSSSIQAMAFNPITHQLCTAAVSDFGLWSPTQKNVTKHRVPSKILCCAWSSDGQHLAIGMADGTVWICDREGEERAKIQRSQPVFTLAWSPTNTDGGDLLAVGCWDQTLSFYQNTGRQVRRDLPLGFDPCSISFLQSEYLVIAGSDRKATLWTKEGVQLGTIGEKSDWIWVTAARPKNAPYCAVGTNDGSITMFQLVFGTVHGLYHDRYAFRENMTNVVLQNLSTDKRVLIKCNDLVKKIAIYKDRLAVQLPERIAIFDLFPDDDGQEINYRQRDRIDRKVDCNLLVVTARHVILCLERRLQLLTFTGVKQREWVLDSTIRYIKVIGGPPDREGLLVGLKSGHVLKIFVDNPFPITLIKHKAAVRCLDLSNQKQQLAVVDEGSNVFVYDLLTKEIVLNEPGANSVAFNTELGDMVCWSGAGQLSIKSGPFPPHQQRMQGFVVGFKGAKVFCLHYLSMTTIDVPQSATLYRYIEKKDFDGAYRVACLGVTDADWRALGHAALSTMRLDVARRAFIRVRDVRYIDLIASIELQRSSSKQDDTIYQGEILAYQGHFQEAAVKFSKAGQAARAIDMFSDLKMWKEAREWCKQGGTNATDLLKRQAEWALDNGAPREAAELFVLSNEHLRAVRIAGDNGWLDMLIDIVRNVNRLDTQTLSKCASYFRQHNNSQYAAETYLKMNDIDGLMTLYVDTAQWEDAFRIARAHPEKESIVYLPYAAWLAERGRFDEALDAFGKAGRTDQALSVLQQLAHNAVRETRFLDAAYYFYRLSMEHLRAVTHSATELSEIEREHLDQYAGCRARAELYYSYHNVHRYTEDPFTAQTSEALFNMSRYLLARMSVEAEIPLGISRVYILYTLAKQATTLEAFKLARTAYERLQALRIPQAWRDPIESAAMAIRAMPFTDKESLLPQCYRCSAPNRMLGPKGDKCSACHHEFVRSFYSFDCLPLVEFQLGSGISDAEVPQILGTGARAARNQDSDGWQQRNTAGGQTMSLEDNYNDGDEDDPFGPQLNGIDQTSSYMPLVADRDILRLLRKSDVFVLPATNPALPTRYYRNMIPEHPVVLCPHCQHFFHEEDFEFAVLEKGGCPFCRTANKKKPGMEEH